MKIKVIFGLFGPKKYIDWYRDVNEMPKLLKYKDKTWEFVREQKDPNGQLMAIYNEIYHKTGEYQGYIEHFEYTFKFMIEESCVCGSIHTSFPNNHMIYCPLWKEIK